MSESGWPSDMAAELRKNPFQTAFLPYKAFEHYYEALVHNDSAKVEFLLKQVSNIQKNCMVNGQFVYESGEDNTLTKALSPRMSRPLHVASMVGSADAVEVLIKHGADVLQKNQYKENIIHSIVAGCSLDLISNKTAVKAYHKLLSHLDRATIKELLMHENLKGFRPLEMAANLGCVLLYEAIQLTPDIYVTKINKRGLIVGQWIDITEYESYEPGSRRAKGPLALFAHSDKEDILSKKHGDIVKCELVMMWLDMKLKSLTPLFVSIGTMHVVFVGSYFLLLTGKHSRCEVLGHNTTENLLCSQSQSLYLNLPSQLELFLTVLSVLFCLSQILFVPFSAKYFFSDRPLYSQNLTRKKTFIADASFFLIIHLISFSCFCVVLILNAVNRCENLLNFLNIFICAVSGWSVLHLLQISKAIGHFTIAIERMATVLLQFCIVFTVVFLPFVHAFHRIMVTIKSCGNQEYCPGVVEHYYNTFIILLNMIDFTQFKDNSNLTIYSLLVLLHVFYVFLLSILLINFLIALLSHSTTEVMESKDIIMTIQKLNALIVFETSLVSWRGTLFLAAHLQKKVFKKHQGKLYLTRITAAKGN